MATPVDLDIDPEAARIEGLLDWARRESEALRANLPAAIDVMYSASPRPRSREDTAERAKNQTSDPTSTIALDEPRLALREQVIRSERAIRNAVIVLRGVRLGLEHALAAWEGTTD